MPEIVAFNEKSATSVVPSETAKRFHDERNTNDCARANPEVGRSVPGLSVPGSDKDTHNSDVPQTSREKTLSVSPAAQEYVQMCLAEQAHTLSAMGFKPEKNLVDQTILQCIELSKIQPDGTFAP